ncbi:hypothetical protein E4T44_02908 [Aureobasidium sp. EXF-8845]|nr:hypothetical protein E4T44_02908 [Aureobasidium sp. EXF-8845]KAI4855619.1 hypothetical protein E4T45_02937 [Aureobasidium sp. EXF-8846]
MSRIIEYEKVVPAMLDLTDSIIRLLNATSHREGCSKHTITALRTLIIRERKTIQRQSAIITDLRNKLSDVEEQLIAVQQSFKYGDPMSRVKVEDEDAKLELLHMAELQRLDESPRQEELSAQAAASTLYDLQNIYSRMAERYAADLRKAEAETDSDWTEDA